MLVNEAAERDEDAILSVKEDVIVEDSDCPERRARRGASNCPQPAGGWPVAELECSLQCARGAPIRRWRIRRPSREGAQLVLGLTPL